jgi:hypothetical protein
MEIANERMEHCDSLLVLSAEGNGGTMLLCSTLKRMIDNESEHVFFGGDDYRDLAKMPVPEFINCSHLINLWSLIILNMDVQKPINILD